MAQQSDGELPLFIDGELLGTAQADTFPESVPCALQFGGLEFHAEGNPEKIDRPFTGRLAEIAIYKRLLTPQEVQQHSRLGRMK